MLFLKESIGNVLPHSLQRAVTPSLKFVVIRRSPFPSSSNSDGSSAITSLPASPPPSWLSRVIQGV